MRYFFLICLLVSLLSSAYAQDISWLKSPIKHELKLAGTFGELRSNHFHTGIDIKSSKGTVGDPLYAVADGFVSRIKISISGYGHALYIDHPNGYTTVYGHMNQFAPEIEEFVEAMQYKNQSYELDTSFTVPVFKVKQGQEIGKMGTTGRSYGPHLHFEVRDTKTEETINPLFYGLAVKDQVAPKIDYLMINFLDDQHYKKGSEKIELSKLGNIYSPKVGTTIRIPAWRVGLAVYVRDLMTGVSNLNGIYKSQLWVDGKLAFEYEMDTISFDHFRYLNAHIDYDHYQKTKDRIHQLYRKSGNRIPIYTESDASFIKLYAEKKRQIEVLISDYEGNTSTIKFDLLRDTNMVAFKEEQFQYFLEYNKAHIINREDIKIKFPQVCLYENLYFGIESSVEKEQNYQSKVYYIGQENIAIEGYFDLYIKHQIRDSALIEKAVIAKCEDNKYISYGGAALDQMVGTKVNQFGTYVVFLDTIPPTITVQNVPSLVSNGNTISFTIDDNLDVKGRAEDLQYSAWVDGKWILFSYDLKNRRIFHKVDDRWSKGKHTFELQVRDDRGNISYFEKMIEKQ